MAVITQRTGEGNLRGEIIADGLREDQGRRCCVEVSVKKPLQGTPGGTDHVDNRTFFCMSVQ